MARGRNLLARDLAARRRLPPAAELVGRRRSLTPDDRFVALPAPVGAPPYRLELADVLGPDATDSIAAAGVLRFHALGDSGGDGNPGPQRGVAAELAAQLDGPEAVSFLYHLGDVVYPHGEERDYRAQFHGAYASYRAPIFGVPGNHDGDRKLVAGDSTLDPWVARFCSRTEPLHDAAVEASRPPSRQPNVYWTLVHPWLRVIGLWTNVPEGGQLATDQLEWLVGELRASPADTITVLAMHQPVYSADVTHGSNLSLVALLDRCYARAGRRPEAVLTGHAHCYQRFTRRVDGCDVPHIVAGAGGYHELHPLGRGVGRLPSAFDGAPELSEVTLDAYEERNHGFLTIAVAPGSAELVYNAVTSRGLEPRDVTRLAAPSNR